MLDIHIHLPRIWPRSLRRKSRSLYKKTKLPYENGFLPHVANLGDAACLPGAVQGALTVLLRYDCLGVYLPSEVGVLCSPNHHLLKSPSLPNTTLNAACHWWIPRESTNALIPRPLNNHPISNFFSASKASMFSTRRPHCTKAIFSSSSSMKIFTHRNSRHTLWHFKGRGMLATTNPCVSLLPLLRMWLIMAPSLPCSRAHWPASGQDLLVTARASASFLTVKYTAT
jgi:hypothetical protein